MQTITSLKQKNNVFEIDDTPNAERIHEYHKSLMPKKYLPMSRMKDNYMIVEDDYVNISSCNVTIDSNCTTYVKQLNVKRITNLTAESAIQLNVIADTNLQHILILIQYVAAETSTPNDVSKI